MADRYDAVVVGAGPNGLAAALELGRAGRSVLVREAAEEVGGGTRSAELTLPGFVHDLCSAVHPLAAASPFFRTVDWARHGVEWIQPEAPFAHPLDDGSAAVVERSLESTAAGLGEDGVAYRRLLAPFVRNVESLIEGLLGPMLRIPRHPLLMARFGLPGLRSAESFAGRFEGGRARAAFAGCAAHSMVPLDHLPTGAVGLMFLVTAHGAGWPIVRGGSGRIADALAAEVRELGGVIETGRPVGSMDELPPARTVVFDVTPRQLLEICGDRLPARYRRGLRRYRYGPGVFKVDWALDGPVPWKAEECRRAGSVHIGGPLEEVAATEEVVARGEVPERPFIVFSQQSLFDPDRAPDGKHTAWGYCHVPNGCPVDMTDRIEAQIERFAPGFRDRVLARHTASPAELEARNANLVGGDIAGGYAGLRQFLLRPVPRLDPYTTPDPGIYLCSSSTPPGPGVHGMSGSYAARAVLRRRR